MTQISSDPDLKGYFVDAKNGDDDYSEVDYVNSKTRQPKIKTPVNQ